MERGRKVEGSPAYVDSKRKQSRLKELVPEVGTAEAARMVGCSQAYASLVANGHRGTTGFILAGLRFSTKLCRRCGNVSGIVCRSHLCLLCEVRDLEKQGVIQIEPEEGSDE